MNSGRLAVRTWWREPVSYSWVVATLRNHAALDLLKVSIGTSGLGLGVVAVLLVLSSEGPQHTAGRTVIGAYAVAAALIGVRWILRPWPAASVSLTVIAITDLAITTNSLLVSNRVGIVNTTALILTGGYLAIFHSAKTIAIHAGWSLLSVLLVTERFMSGAGPGRDLPLAVATTLIMLLGVVLVLPTLHFCYWVLRTDALSDPLTTLLNRRGLDYHLAGLFDAGPPICAMVVDLDRFKMVNDTFGHQEGDRVLARTAARLRDIAEPAATIARTGGEEFTIVDRLDVESARVLAERLRRAVEDSGGATVAVTASVGVAVLADSAAAGGHRSLEHLLGCADTAMYRAKELGGNTVVVEEA